MPLSIQHLSLAAATARGLAIDAISGCKSGHLGLPLGAAEIGAALFGSVMRYNPEEPRWAGRDRFVLSAGHGSMFLYAWLHLAGYRLSLDDLKAFRKLGSHTPGHPEFAETPGVEITSGPLGQGVGNAVGIALSLKKAMAELGGERASLLDSTVFCLAGDGCLQEGVAMESTELAGHLKLDNLVLIWDSNAVTLDAMAAVTQSQDVRQRYEACGWHVFEVDGHNLDQLQQVLLDVRDERDGMPKLVIARTEIARGIPQVAGNPKGHGEGGGAFADEARAGLGLPAERFHVSQELCEAFAVHVSVLKEAAAAWHKDWQAGSVPPHLAIWASGQEYAPGYALDAVSQDKPLATRKAASIELQELFRQDPRLFSLNADLYGSNLNYFAEGGDVSPGEFAGRNLRVGIREHAMGALMNGLAYEGLYIPVGGTFMVFSDYLRPSIRLAALAGLRVVYWFTHDSVGVGEDGPTHQPVESVAALRMIPGLEVYRPADQLECRTSLLEAIGNSGPTVLSLTRQNVELIKSSAAVQRAEAACRGAYVLNREEGPLELVLISCGSELPLAQAVAEVLTAEGRGVRVVSMLSMERFEKQEADWQQEVLPVETCERIAIEAGRSLPWYRYTGLDGRVIGIDRFGLSAPGDQIMEELGLTVEALLEASRELLA